MFFRNADAYFKVLEAAAQKVGLQGIRPSDGGLSRGFKGTKQEIAKRIFDANLELIKTCDGVLANLQPFRNALMPDDGTVWEIGFAYYAGKPIAGYLPERDVTYEQKVVRQCGDAGRDTLGLLYDMEYGHMIEEFEQPMNLMLSHSVELFESPDLALRYLADALSA